MSDSIFKFGDRLIATGDLDPVYIAIVGAQLDYPQLARVLIAYWCFYHLGAAAWLSEHDNYFWDAMTIAAENTAPFDRWPRASERRHFRGAKCVAAVRALARSAPEDLIGKLTRLRTAGEVINAVMKWPMFGPWIGFKAADMLERCAGVPLRFPDDTCLMYAEPAAAITMLAQSEGQTREHIYSGLRSYFAKRKAPPKGDRACGVQEVETICCKWKSMRGGHYHIGKDITEVRHALLGWGDTAQRMHSHMPKEVRQGLFSVLNANVEPANVN
jgi:hypothetical protein